MIWYGTNIWRQWKPKPASSLIADAHSETCVPVAMFVVEISVVTRPIDAGSDARQRQLSLLLFKQLVPLLDQFPCDDSEDFLDAFAILGRDLMAAVPAYILPPESTAPV